MAYKRDLSKVVVHSVETCHPNHVKAAIHWSHSDAGLGYCYSAPMGAVKFDFLLRIDLPSD